MKNSTKIITKMLFVFFLFVSLASATSTAYSQDQASNKTEVSLEIDPATFAFKGYAFHLRIKPKNSQNKIIGFGTYAMNFPSLLVDLNPENKDKGWNLRLNQGYGLFGEHHFNVVNRGWFVGTQLAMQQYKIKHDEIAGESDFWNFLALGYGGYTFQPFEMPIYFKVWGGLGYTTKVSGENTLGDQTYDVAPLLIFSALHIGYTF